MKEYSNKDSQKKTRHRHTPKRKREAWRKMKEQKARGRGRQHFNNSMEFHGIVLTTRVREKKHKKMHHQSNKRYRYWCV